MKEEFSLVSLQTVLYIQAMQSSSILIHLQRTVDTYEHLKDLGLKYTYGDREIDVVVNNIEELDDEELCEHYGINYDLVNCIEAM